MTIQGWLAFDDSRDRKARGAFFTPPELAEFLAEWAVRGPRDRILDPSCGEAALLLAAGHRLRALGGRATLHGFDLHLPSIDAARQLLAHHKLKGDLQAADFFDTSPQGRFDAVIGNPPYIRYQSFAGADRLKAQQAALAQGVRLSGLANAWAAFVIHATAFLKPNGRLAVVLPAALLSVNYAAPIRRFLLSRFGAVKLVMFEERVFPEVQEEVVLLLAEGKGPTAQFDVVQVRDVRALKNLGGMPAVVHPWTPVEAADKWTEALLPTHASEIYSQISGGSKYTALLGWGDTGLGMVTGNNKFFTLTAVDVEKLGLAPEELHPISPPGSRHLRGLTFTKKAFTELAKAGQRSFLFYPAEDKPSAAALKYIRSGEQQGVHEAFKCAVRTPWWRVPGLRVPDLFLTYMNQDTPRLVSNGARAAHLNSVHGVSLKSEYRQLGLDLLPLAMLNSVTLLGAELVGRSYGGGLLKVEPKEADHLPVPSPELVKTAADHLRALRPQLTKYLRHNALQEIVKSVDDVLAPFIGLQPTDLAVLTEAHAMMAARRSSRSGKPR